jgi:hypothetical protein
MHKAMDLILSTTRKESKTGQTNIREVRRKSISDSFPE